MSNWDSIAVTGINRRQCLQLLAGTLLLPGLARGDNRDTRPLLASAARSPSGQYHLYLLNQHGDVLLNHPLPARAHHTEVHPQRSWLACIARRPGTFVDVIDYREKRLITRITADTGRHFFGHGIFSEDGRYLICTENNLADGQGRVVFRDVDQDFRISADFPSHGIGPHELRQQPGSNTLVIANGGIRTHPDQGRKKLNLDTMTPSLVRLDMTNGALQEQQFMPAALHQLSIRHIDTNRAGETAIALQYQGPAENNPPLVAVHRPFQPLQLLSAPAPVDVAMKRYCGSVRFDSSGRYAAVSAPRGDLITFWDLHTDRFHSSLRSRDGCGIAATDRQAEFIISAGTGRCISYDLRRGQKIRLKSAIKPAWDNHLAYLKTLT